VKTPEEIATGCERAAGWMELHRPGHQRVVALLREAAEALRKQERELSRDSGDSMFLSEIVSDLERERNQAKADRDALLAVARAAAKNASLGCDCDSCVAYRALPEHLRRQVEGGGAR
jgi:hypothetical protein